MICFNRVHLDQKCDFFARVWPAMLSRRLVSAPRTRLHKRGLSAAPQKVAKVLEGQIVHSLGLEHLEIIPDGRIGINSAGKILFVSKSPQQKQRSEQEFGYSKAQIENLGDKFLIPGFIDTHAHAPQYVFTGFFFSSF